MKDWKIFATSLSVLSMLSACAGNRNLTQGRPEIAVRRGATWATYSFAPPRIFGPTAELQLKRGVLAGFVEGKGVNIKITATAADGFAPNGPADLKVTTHEGRIEADGLWNGGPTHLALGPASLHGSVTIGHRRMGASEIACGYELDRLVGDGALTGSSACGEMAEETLLEISPAVRQSLTPAELAVVLATILAAPPL